MRSQVPAVKSASAAAAKSGRAAISPMSAPATKARLSPVMTIAPTSVSRSPSSRAAFNSRSSSLESAFIFFGRFSRISSTRPRRSVRMRGIVVLLHSRVLKKTGFAIIEGVKKSARAGLSPCSLVPIYGRDEGVFGAMAHKQGNSPNHRHSGRRGDSRDGTCSESPATAGRDFDGKTSAAGDFFTRSIAENPIRLLPRPCAAIGNFPLHFPRSRCKIFLIPAKN